MPESDLPSGTADSSTPLSFDEGVSAIDSLITDSDFPNPGEQAGATTQASDTDEPEGSDDDAADTGVDDTPEEEDDGPDVASGGKFAADDAKVTLKDGTVLSVQDLKRGFISQQYFTRETTRLKEERSAFDRERAEVGNYAQTLAQQRDFLLQAAQQFLPQPPDVEMLDYDPIGYQRAEVVYRQQIQVLNNLFQQQQANQGFLTREQEQANSQRRAAEVQKLLDDVPEFRDQKVFKGFWREAEETMAEYGYTAEELQAADDHRLFKAMRDLVRYRKARQSAPKVRQDLQGKPQVMAGGKRMDPKARTSREAQARTEQLRKTGSFEAGVAALMDLS